ncbi:phosphoribosyl-ATP pyrophosphatase [bacterium BMS3Abin05]|nr:phosphoribosyl-ATP pyrophosphatase [bacterium BMS3Abin05]GBE26844.1 phosphoribosyl-ATP pyrophosphatase [bacterium BMS3Bbin03]HDZ11102.1 bifunctional phosphoribosyl-AMP cyclohydrolase/phosphoribosyl-ATP diphosphatase HisIE [Bacteroidota bacterium]
MKPNFDQNELLPAILQDVHTGQVLMLGYMNKEAYGKTLETGLAHFYSRSRKKLWLKGETSGNFQHVKEIRIDCDSDSILLKVDPDGPTCHTGHQSCFYRAVQTGPDPAQAHILEALEDLILERKKERPDHSYTVQLFTEGKSKIAQKVGEEATETIVAYLSQSGQRLVEESADLLYHLLVLLADAGVPLDSLWRELEKRRK